MDTKLKEVSWEKKKHFFYKKDCAARLTSDELGFNEEKILVVRRGIPND